MTHASFLGRIVLAVALISVVNGSLEGAHAQPEILTVAAANSLKDALRKALPVFESQHPEVQVRVIYGPSQTLRRQIEEGAPIDVYLPSLFEEIEDLEKKGLVLNGTKQVFASTSLVLITGSSTPTPVSSLNELREAPVRRLAIGDPKTSSVGKVAVEFLKNSKLAPTFKSQLVYGQHSRAVLDLVAAGEAEIGVVYRTDAASSNQIRVLDTAPAGSHRPIRYGIAAVWTAKNHSAARELTDFLLSGEIQPQLAKLGFDPADSRVAKKAEPELR
ncbi:Molybdenum ABC transporter, periplasmic binding protein [Nitrospira sp. KM1]|uniref:molybdate ABC transporter substrate-binding protein n=1 Tax=Nitrospira sp. KM1 TaxID=1936990 RepID=UPI0013A75E54|nr:molybdate ABC transporter substrate-binding protein [Nitrospira sp. KM1]BCA53373.1 Molybdenum ABC transporter, periplasmic binding protein [Nitrospira sp. KM1]